MSRSGGNAVRTRGGERDATRRFDPLLAAAITFAAAGALYKISTLSRRVVPEGSVCVVFERLRWRVRRVCDAGTLAWRVPVLEGFFDVPAAFLDRRQGLELSVVVEQVAMGGGADGDAGAGTDDPNTAGEPSAVVSSAALLQRGRGRGAAPAPAVATADVTVAVHYAVSPSELGRYLALHGPAAPHAAVSAVAARALRRICASAAPDIFSQPRLRRQVGLDKRLHDELGAMLFVEAALDLIAVTVADVVPRGAEGADA